MQNKPLFSVIVPVFNNEKMIIQCIESIINQTLKDFELIIIDDGSTDNTYSVCEKYTHKNSNIILLKQKNKGVSSARNLGLSKASGKWCVFVDSDDTLKENHLEELSKTDSDITWIGYDMYDENGNHLLQRLVEPINANTPELVNQSIFSLCHEKNFFAIIWTKKFKMEIIHKYQIAFDESITICEDILFTHKYLQHCKSISCIKNATYNYINREGSLSHGGTNLFHYFDFIKQYNNLINQIDYEEILKQFLIKDLENRFTYIIQKSFKPFNSFSKHFRYDVILFGIKIKYSMKYKNNYILSKNVSLAYFFCYFMWILLYFPRKAKGLLKKLQKIN